jgi:hypothetical protein
MERDLRSLDPVGKQVGRQPQGGGTGVAVLKSARVGDDACVETGCDVVIELDPRVLQKEGDDLRGR